MSYQRLIYRSHAVALDDPNTKLGPILAVAARNNPVRGITGALTFCHGTFVQVLEGPPAAIGQLMDVLARDPRHRDIRVLGRWTASYRLFSGWAMANAPSVDAPAATQDLVQRANCGLQLVGILVNLTTGVPLSI